jgi:hypothetical protein
MRVAHRPVRVSWQIVPSRLAEMLHDGDATKVERVTAAFLQPSVPPMAAFVTHTQSRGRRHLCW